ncbi:nicotianamine synthase-like [Phalaenopsis equestris]|uniref:nicotianamine synthase-like n=1 Tax=Phalaenopsis equestris TaxID=78828 RepID=UPI0009E2E0AB|nr:nicotianamine synthase-like [Phalaenopsis equestris]
MVMAANLQHCLLISQTPHSKEQKPIVATAIAAEEDKLIATITELYNAISNLPSLHPSPQVNSLFSSLVAACIPSYPSLFLTSLPPSTLSMRSHLISLCSTAESSLELHYSSLLLQLSLSSSSLLPHLPLFPYFSNYLSLSLLESSLLQSHLPHHPSLFAFLGSGPLPLSSIILASRHFPSSSFHNYDIDPTATAKASALVSNERSLASRMEFITADASTIGERLRSYGVVFLAALVGLDTPQKVAVVEHLARFMAPGAMLVVRSAHGARMFLYPVIEPGDLKGFEVLSVYHPDDEVINSVIVARKMGAMVEISCKCCEAKKMKMKLKNGHGGVVVEELPTGA